MFLRSSLIAVCVLKEGLYYEASSLKASRSTVTVFAAVFPKRKQNSMQTHCSFKSAIEKSTKTMTEAQEKNHTDPIDLSSRTPLCQLMRRAGMYTHQAGAEGSTVPFHSRKEFSLFLGPPSYDLQIIFVLIADYSVNYKVMASVRTKGMSTLTVRGNFSQKENGRKISLRRSHSLFS